MNHFKILSTLRGGFKITSSLIEFIKLVPNKIRSIGLTCGFVLLLNQYVGLRSFRDEYYTFIVLIFIVSFSDLAIEAMKYLTRLFKRHFTLYSIRKERINNLKDLTIKEKEILRYYIDNNVKDQVLDYSDGTVTLLEYYKIIGRGSNYGVGGFGVSYIIQPWAWDYLKKHKFLLD